MTINISIVVFCALIQLGVLVFYKSLINTSNKNTKKTTTCGTVSDSDSATVVVGSEQHQSEDKKNRDLKGDDKQDGDAKTTEDEMQVRCKQNLLSCRS